MYYVVVLLGLDQAFGRELISQTFSSVGYAYITIPLYPSGQIGFIVATKGQTTCKKTERKPSNEVQADLKYYSFCSTSLCPPDDFRGEMIRIAKWLVHNWLGVCGWRELD
jgi:hypothetical protein